jgi:hypothetical protein
MNNAPKKGLPVSVLRNAEFAESDCTLGGLTSKHIKAVLLMDEPIAQVFAPRDDAPALCLVRRVIGGRPYVHAVPCDDQGTPLPGSWAAGGNFIHTSDSRFPNQYPISVHDRDMRKERR